jgi:hypothetical protein
MNLLFLFICSINWWQPVSSIAVALSFIITTITFIINTRERSRNNRRQEIELYLKIKNDVDSEKSKQLSYSILQNNIYSRLDNSEMMILFRIDNDIEVELSTDLLNHLEDLYLIHSLGLMSIKTIISGFGNTIITLHECKIIKEYITHIRHEFSDDELYNGFDELYDLIK